jgi:potassium efflux system protein
MKKSLLILLLPTFIFLSAGWINVDAAVDSSPTKALQVVASEKELNGLQQTIITWSKSAPSADEIRHIGEKLANLRKEGEKCVDETAAGLSVIVEKLAAVGEHVTDEPRDISDKRKELLAEKKQHEQRGAICRLLILGSRELHEQVRIYRKNSWSSAFMAHSVPLWQLSFQEPTTTASYPVLQLDYGKFFVWGLVSLIIFLPLAYQLRRSILKQALSCTVTPSGRLTLLLSQYEHRLVPMAFISAITLAGFGGENTAIVWFGLAVVVSLVLSPVVETVLCGAVKTCTLGRLARWTILLVLIGAVTHFILPQGIAGEAVVRLMKAVYLLLLMTVSLRFLFTLTEDKEWQTLKSLRIPIAILLMSGPVADWLGYQVMGVALVRGVYTTLGAALLLRLLYRVISDGLDRMQSVEAVKSTDPEQAVEEKKTENLFLLRSIGVLLTFLYGYFLLLAWNISASNMAGIKSFLIDGFQIGAATIVPSRLVGALALFVILLLFARWLRRQMGDLWLTRTTLDKGARQSIVTLSTYAIIGAAVLLALSIIGVDFQNLAIIAGALSVGIGFGLQNIINNFVSGLILLFERPVRPGDWVVVGGTEGYVKRVSIRYTLIQTFDRADVLVPNSELISNQVTNWMFRDSLGRVIVPVGVAYGTDTLKVKEILLKTAKEHPLVLIGDSNVSDPKVLFIGFGDSSLNFELRCFIKDVDYRLSTRSDLLFAIDAVFKQEGIEIPFPQRVLHMADEDDGNA